MSDSRRPPADPPRAGQRLRQDRSRGAGPRRCTRPASSSSPPAPPPRGSPPPASRSPRSRSSPASPSAWTAASRRCTRRCTPASSPTCASSRHREQLARARRRAVRPGRRQPLPVPRDRRLRRDPRRVRRADRHRRPVDGPRRGQEPPVGRRRHQPGAVRRRARRRHGRAASTSPPASGSPPRRSSTPPRTTWPSPPGSRQRATRRRRRHRLPGLPRRHLDSASTSCATARTRTSAPRSTPTARPGRVSPRPSSCTARRCRTTTTSDTDAARRAAYDHDEPCVAIIKHANPCGIAVGADVAEAHRKAHACDPLSAFGGVIAVNRPVTVEMAEQVAEIFTEVIVAPGYEDGAARGARPQEEHPRAARPGAPVGRGSRSSRIDGGALLQVTDRLQADGDDPANWTLATGEAARPRASSAELAFAWRACRAVKSNAILLAKDGASVGVGMGQVNRVDSAKLAVERAGASARAAPYAASDAFFPFPDGLEILADGRRQGRRPAGRFGPRRAGRRGREEGRRDDVLHRHAALLPLIRSGRHPSRSSSRPGRMTSRDARMIG